jgi:hypothetical protein
VANHWNGIVDPLLILTTARYRASPIAKSTLFAVPGLRQLLTIADAVPVTRRRDAPGKGDKDNDAIFDQVAAHLSAGGNVLIFPEGTSHSEPQVLPLKSGAARMLARAHERGGRGLSLQAVALDFDAKDTFRSRAAITYGPVLDVDATAAATGTGEPLVRALVDRAATDLSALVVSGRSRGELRLVRDAAEILVHEHPQASLAGQSEIAREIVTRARALGPDDPAYRAVADAVAGYARARRALGLSEEQVARGRTPLGLVRLLRGLYLTLLAPLALVGALLYFVPYRLPRLATRLARGEDDVVSTYKLGIGMLAFPLWSALLLGLALHSGDLHQRMIHVALVLLSPWAALRWLDRLDDHRGLRLLQTASTAGRRQLARLRLLRGRAIDALQAAPRAPQQGRTADG